MKDIHVRVTLRTDATPEKLFDALLDPKQINGWMFGPNLRDEEVLKISVDPRVGGEFSFLVKRQGHEIEHVGTYLEIDRPKRLVFTWAAKEPGSNESSRVVIEIVPRETGSHLILTHEMSPKWEDYADRVRSSWAQMLGALDQIVSS